MHRRRITLIDLHVAVNCSQIAPWRGERRSEGDVLGRFLLPSTELRRRKSVFLSDALRQQECAGGLLTALVHCSLCFLRWFDLLPVREARFRAVRGNTAFPSVTSASAFVFGGEFLFLFKWWREMNCGDFTSRCSTWQINWRLIHAVDLRRFALSQLLPCRLEIVLWSCHGRSRVVFAEGEAKKWKLLDGTTYLVRDLTSKRYPRACKGNHQRFGSTFSIYWMLMSILHIHSRPHGAGCWLLKMTRTLIFPSPFLWHSDLS